MPARRAVRPSYLVIAEQTHAAVAPVDCDAPCTEGVADSFALNPGLVDLIRREDPTIGEDVGQLGLDDSAYGGGFIPDFVKLDIEGAEVAALRSADRILTERLPALIVEVHSRESERDGGEDLAGYRYRPVVASPRKIAPDVRLGEPNRWLVAA